MAIWRVSCDTAPLLAAYAPLAGTGRSGRRARGGAVGTHWADMPTTDEMDPVLRKRPDCCSFMTGIA